MIKDLHKKLIAREVASHELTLQYLKDIKEKDAGLNAFLSVDEEGALKQAKKADDHLIAHAGDPTPYIPLLGIPCAVKDNIMVLNMPCTAGSKILENYIAPYSATVVKKLKKAGAVILGKTNLDEFAMGSSTENSAYGAAKNAVDPERVPGGSSGGSATAVAAGLAPYALGSDTGGSIRQPAAFSGMVGFKPTYGAVSRSGLIAMASSLDQIGPITKTVEDARIVFEAMRGRDRKDATSLEARSTKYARPASRSEAGELRNLKIGAPKEYFGEGLDKKVGEKVKEAIEQYEKNGAKVKEISLPHTEYGLAAYYIIMPSEVSANLARYDGVKYGAVSGNLSEESTLLDVYLKTRGEYLGQEVRRRIMLGTHALSSGYYDAYYLKAQRVRSLILEDFKKAFSEVDVIMTPTTPTLPFKFGEKKNPLAMYLADVFTVGINLAGVPAISIPCGAAKEGDKDLPVGLQIIGPQKADFLVLDVAEQGEALLSS